MAGAGYLLGFALVVVGGMACRSTSKEHRDAVQTDVTASDGYSLDVPQDNVPVPMCPLPPLLPEGSDCSGFIVGGRCRYMATAENQGTCECKKEGDRQVWRCSV